MSVRLKLTLSYAGFIMLAGALLLAAVWLFLLRYVPYQALHRPRKHRKHSHSWGFSRPVRTSSTFSLRGQPRCSHSC